jgi:hypothetical protein
VFSAFENDGYLIYAIESSEQLAGTAIDPLPVNAAVLPPRRAGEGPVYAALANESLGLPAAEATAAPALPAEPIVLDSGWTSSASPPSASASIRSARMPPVASPSCSATCSAGTP